MNSKIDQFIRKVMDDHQLPGLAIGIVKENQPFYESGFGITEYTGDHLITSNSLFHLASISKVFVATGIMQLVEQGRLVLDDPVVKFLPEFRLKSGEYGLITIRQLLSHTAGLPDITDYHWDRPEYDAGALERYVRSLETVELLSKPGEVFFYSNIGYEVLGHLIAKVAEMSFEDYIKKHILIPSGMITSTHFKENVPPELAIAPHLRMLTTSVSDIYPYHRAHAPSSTLHASVHEMNSWAIANLNRGHISDATILNPDSYKELWKIVTQTGRSNQLVHSIGLGWFLGNHRGRFTVSHSGQDVGFTSQLILLPGERAAVTVLCNAAPAPTRQIALGILDIVFGFEPVPVLPSIIVPLGREYKKGGEEAMKRYYKILQQEASSAYDFNPKGIYEVVSALLDSNLNTDAIPLINLGLEISPENAEGYEYLARANFQMGNFDDALQCALRSLEIEPNNPFLRQQIKPLLRDG